MANKEHLDILAKGVEEWNAWRKGQPELRPDLDGAHLMEANLSLANLHGAKLSYADLSGAKLTDANLGDANLNVADLHVAVPARAHGEPGGTIARLFELERIGDHECSVDDRQFPPIRSPVLQVAVTRPACIV